jgi:hypothetical protein
MIEKLNFPDLLRYGFSGGAFLLSLTLACGGFDCAKPGGTSFAEGTGLALVALVIGSFIYSIHRALLHRSIAWLLIRILERNHPDLSMSEPFLRKIYKRDLARWKRRHNYPMFQRNMDTWSSQILFLYGCGWAILLGAIIGHLSSPGAGNGTFWLLLLLSLVSLLAAGFQDYIAHYYDCKLMATDDDLSNDLREPLGTKEPR